MPTEAQLLQGLQAADAAGNSADAQHFADQIKAMRASPASTLPEQAPRWDVLGDIGRAASGATSSLMADASNAFTRPKGETPTPFNSHIASLAKLPVDALGVLSSPITGLMHGVAGSALSYALPTPDKDVTSHPITALVNAAHLGTVIPQNVTDPLFSNTYHADPKKAADQVLDSSMIGIGPRGIGAAPAVEAAAATRAASKAARSDAILKNRAIDKVNARASQDQLNPGEVAAAQQRAGAGGDPLTLMDLGDKNVRGLAGAVYRAPGDAGKAIQDFLKTRDAAATPNLTQDIQGSVSTGSTYGAAQDLLKGRSAAARPAYEAAESVGPVHSDRLQEFLGDPEIKAGLKRGLKLERQNARAENRPFKDSDYAVTGYKDGNWDEPIFDKVPTMKSMIVANEGLGAQIADMVNPVTGRPTKDGLALKKYRDAFQGELDNLSGGKYAAARDTWSGPAQSMEALTDGRQHFTRTESNAQLQAEFNALTPGDKDFYRMGAAEAKVDAMERAPDASDKSKRVINSEQDRKRFSMLFDSPSQAQQFIDAVARKRQMFDTKNSVMGNSATAGRQIEDADNGNFDLALGGAKTAGHALSGNLLGTLKGLYETKRSLGLRNNPALNSQIAALLTNPNLAVGNGAQLLPRLTVPPKQFPIPALGYGLAGASLPQIRPKQ